MMNMIKPEDDRIDYSKSKAAPWFGQSLITIIKPFYVQVGIKQKKHYKSL